MDGFVTMVETLDDLLLSKQQRKDAFIRKMITHVQAKNGLTREQAKHCVMCMSNAQRAKLIKNMLRK